MTDAPLPMTGATLVLGPSNAGKTRLTADALTTWVERDGARGVVVFDFGPELERDGRVLGGRLTRFTAVPDGAWHGVLDAHAPRAESADDAGALERAADNARRAAAVFEAAPDRPRAVFVNDATIPFQHSTGDVAALTDYCDRADLAVLNALESDELGRDDPVSRREREVLQTLRTWADRVLDLGD